MVAIRDIAPSAILPAENAAVYDIATLMNTIYQQNIEPTQAGRVPKRLANKIYPLLKGQPRFSYNDTNDYLEMLLLVMGALDITQLNKPPFPDMKACIAPGTQLARWSQLDLFQQTKRLLEHWTTNGRWLDAAGINYDPWAMQLAYYVNTLQGRQALLKQLRLCSLGQWYSIESLLDQLREEQPLAFHNANAYASKAELRKIKQNAAAWMASDGELYIGMIESSLHDLGLVELGYAATTQEELAESNPCAFKLTELGASVISEDTQLYEDVAASYKQTSNQQSLIVQPNFELLLLQPDLPTLYNILPFAQANNIGIASSLKLTATSLLRGLSAGKSIAQIVQTLTEHSQKETPTKCAVYALRLGEAV